MRRMMLVFCMLVAGCEIAPRYVETSHEVDGYLARQAYKSACVGLKARRDNDLRTYTAEKLAAHPESPVATACLCAALYQADKHSWDPAVAAGLKATGRDDLAKCLVPALSDDAIEQPALLVRRLGATQAPAALSALREVARAGGTVELRAAAAEALSSDKGADSVLLALLTSDAAPEVRAAAARSLAGRDAEQVVAGVSKAALKDADGGVRAAALKAVVRLKLPTTDQMVCKAMLNDPDERVRDAAVRAFHGTKRKPAIACLEKRLLAYEESSTVRTHLLKALGASPSDEAALVLCRGINPFLRMYVKDQIADDIAGVGIVKAQNDRDWERSYKCVSDARAKGGLSCYARHHLGVWLNDLGGKASTPWCPGMVKMGPG